MAGLKKKAIGLKCYEMFREFEIWRRKSDGSVRHPSQVLFPQKVRFGFGDSRWKALSRTTTPGCG
jgi:hypothetical protein